MVRARSHTTGRRSGTTTRRQLLAAAVTAGAGLGATGRGRVDDRDGRGTAPPASSRLPEEGPGDDGDAGPPGDTAGARSTVIGANLNGRPRRLLDAPGLLEASGTTWVRAFVDVREKLASEVEPEADPDVVALRRAAVDSDCALVVSLKWDFRANWGDKEPIRVPEPGSALERALCRTAARYLAAIGAPVEVVVLGNEPMWETPDGDIRVDDPPVLRFTRTVKDHLVDEGDHGEPQYLVGALNRSHDARIRRRLYPEFYRGAYELAREDPDVDGVDLHLHYAALDEAASMLAAAREALPDGTVAATEFSPVFRYAQHVNTPLAWSDAGAQFVRDHGLPSSMTAVSYFEYAKRNPRPPEEVAALYEAVPWYDVDHVAAVHSLLSDHGVRVGTFGFLQDRGMRQVDWTDGWMPFHINFLYQPAIMRARDGVADTAHPHYIEDYRELSG